MDERIGPSESVAKTPGQSDLVWLAAGAVYTALYFGAGALLRSAAPSVLLWFRTGALLIPPLAGVIVIVRQRHRWAGCQWLFWVTVALGLVISAVAFVGWALDEVLIARETSWLSWPAVFALFGAVAPLFALLAQPHRGPREPAAATTAVDIAGIAVLAGYLYSYVVIGADLGGSSGTRGLASLVFLSELQQLLVASGLTVAAVVAGPGGWRVTYRRLALGALVGLVMLSLSNASIWLGAYRPVFVFDFLWILPFFFVPWAGRAAPSSADAPDQGGEERAAPSRPWLIFGVLAVLPVTDSVMRALFPLDESIARFRDLSMGVTVVSVLPLLMARLAVERAELRQTGARLRLLAGAMEQADDLMLIFARDGRIVHANAAFSRAVGYDPTELSAMRIDDLATEVGRLRASDLLNDAGGGHVWRGTLARRRKDGTTFVSSCVVAPLRDRLGHLRHFVAVERDVTDDTRLRNQLIRSEYRYRSLVDNAPLGIFRASAGGRVVSANDTFATLLGRPPGQPLAGSSLVDVCGDAELVNRLFDHWRSGAAGSALEVPWGQTDGRRVQLRLTGHAVPDPETNEEVFEVFAEDVTGQRELEAELRQAQKMEAIGRLAGGVAHDFNNQLTVVFGYTDGLLTQLGDSPIATDLQQIRRAASNAAALTRRLLAFSRRQTPSLDIVDLNDMVRRTEQVLPRLLGEDVVVEARLGDGSIPIRADPVLIEQVLLNLAVNARDAMPDGGRLTIETAAVELFDALRKPGPVSIKPGRYMLLAVTDTGVGMDPDVRARVFEPFFTTKEQGKGTGLGLSTVYGIVKQLGGYVWVYSEPLLGSTFKLYFPAAPVLTAVAGAEPQRAAPEMGSEVVLLVEDEEGLREFAANMLRRHGYQVIEAATGEEGLALAGRTPHIDLVLTDVVMPGLSGPEMVSRLRRLGPVRAMFMSGYAERALREGIKLQQDRFLEKPFGPTELLRHVRQALDARSENAAGDTAVVT